MLTLFNFFSLVLVSLALYPLSQALSTETRTETYSSVSIPLKRGFNAHDFAGLDELGTWARKNREYIECKYSNGMNDNLDKRATGMNLLVNQLFVSDSSYFGSLAVGTPPVLVSVLLDTGSSDLWLATADSSGKHKRSKAPTLYNPSASTTFKQENGKHIDIGYNSGDVNVSLVSDMVAFSGFEVQQTFGIVPQDKQNLYPAGSMITGIMGLAFQQAAATGVMPFWQALAETSGILNDTLFAIQLTRFSDPGDDARSEAGGTFTLGAVNSSLYQGDIDYQDVPSQSSGLWLQELSSLEVNGQSISLPSGDNSLASIDTGTMGVICPADVLEAIFKAIPGSMPGTGNMEGYYLYPCSASVTLSVSWGSSKNTWSISPEDFKLTSFKDGDMCYSTFYSLSTQSSPPFIFGDAFLKNVYSVFRADPLSVGFATLSTQALAMNNGQQHIPSPTLGHPILVQPTATQDSFEESTTNGGAPIHQPVTSLVSGLAMLTILTVYIAS